MARDPYKYFRVEAVELLEALGRGLVTLEQDVTTEATRTLMRLAHTLKGAAGVVRQKEISAIAHRLEDLLAGISRVTQEPGESTVGDATVKTLVDEGLSLVEQVRQRVAGLGASASSGAGDAAPVQAPQGEMRTTETARARSQSVEGTAAVPVDVAELDLLLEGLAGAIGGGAGFRARRDEAGRLARELQVELERRRLRSGEGRDWGVLQALAGRVVEAVASLGRQGDEVWRELVDLREVATELRLVPVQVLVADLERSVRDAAQTLGRKAILRANVGHARLDARILAELRGALRHVVRNAVAHGIEDEAARRAMGKAAVGTIELAIERRGSRLLIRCSDDGRGIDVAAVRQAAIARGLLAPAAADAMDANGLVVLLLRGGVSTSGAVDVVSGRGVGLDVVREVVSRIRGEIMIRTTTGAGTTVEMIVPISLASVPVLVVEASGFGCLIPLDTVREVRALRSQEVTPTGDGKRVVVDGVDLRFESLTRIVDDVDPGKAREPDSAFVVLRGPAAGPGNDAALGVTRVVGIQTAVVRALPSHVTCALASGVAIDDEGRARLVLSSEAIVGEVATARSDDAPSPTPTRPRLLVIDDSLTTRMLEQSILESAGYDLDLAMSAEEALDKAAGGRYGLFIVDVEMPGMSGFEFVAKTQADPSLREIPSILVTSRGDPEDRRRGRDVGARAYIVKGEFDQRDLLDAVRSLVG